jgi:hypothetical protein
MAKGKVTAGIVLAFFSEPASLCFNAAVVVDGQYPIAAEHIQQALCERC